MKSVVYEPQIDSNDVICPYCLHSYEAEHFDERERDDECEQCGGVYTLYDVLTITHHTSPQKQEGGQ